MACFACAVKHYTTELMNHRDVRVWGFNLVARRRVQSTALLAVSFVSSEALNSMHMR